MGVSGLLGLLKSIQKPCSLKEFHGKVIGVDAYGWLHRGAVAAAVELALGKSTTKHVDFAMHRVRMLIHFGVTPYIVFDGDRLPSKKSTEESRGQRRRDSKTAGLELLRLGKTSQAFQELQKAVDVTPEMARQLIDELKRNNIQYVVAPYEADSQMAYLEKKGKIDAILSEDSDLLVFGAKCLLTKLDAYGSCIMIKRDDFTACRDINLNGWTDEDFRCMAILSGCDYLDGIHKMGLKTAYRLIRKHKTIQKIIQGAQLEGKFKIPSGYVDSFIQADMTFRYQWVYCPEARCLVNLTEPETENQLDGLTYIGKYVEAVVASRVASGELNPMTKQVILSQVVPNQFRRTPLGPRSSNIIVTPDDTAKCKKIDTFFKPKRTPLAELDPNSFTPSSSQQRLLQANASREWASEPVTRPSLITTITTAQNRAISVFRTPATVSRPPKRPRLCEDLVSSPCARVLDEPSEQSPFFASSVVTRPTSSAPQATTKGGRAEDSLWSDDSLDTALVTLAESPSSAPIPKKSKFAVFADQDSFDHSKETVAFEGSTYNTPEPEEVERSNPFSKYLLKEIESISTRYSYSSSSSASLGAFQTQANESSEQTSFTEFDGETNRPPPAQAFTEVFSHVHNTPAPSPCPSFPQPHLYALPSAKGSEDMLLVAESDAGSIADSEANQNDDFCVPASSPRAVNDSDDILEGTPSALPRLNLSRFAFCS